MLLQKEYHPLKILLILFMIQLNKTEWIEIAQRARSASSTTKKPTKILVSTRTSIFHINNQSNNFETTPSPEWVAYQKERFGNKNGFNAHQLVISADESLKNSAQIVVPARVTSKNQIFRTRSKLEVKPENEPEVSIIQTSNSAAQNIETTSRKISSGSLDAQENSNNANQSFEFEQETTQSDKNPNQTNADDNEEISMPSLNGFLNFLKSLRKIWIYNAALNIDEKIQYLIRFKDLLMMTIENKFTALWQPIERQRRKKRGLLEESNLHFPPSAALMSITFLTFAVFLIKLVLQVVHIIKSKHYNMGTISTSGTFFKKL